MNPNTFIKIARKYKKCPMCGAGNKTDWMSVEVKDEIITISCSCGFYAMYDNLGKEICYGNKDASGGVHDSGIGWNPNGVFCGECSASDCSSCQQKDRTESV